MLKLKNFLVLNINMDINITDGIIKKYAIALIVMLIVISPAIGYFLYTSWWGTMMIVYKMLLLIYIVKEYLIPLEHYRS